MKSKIQENDDLEFLKKPLHAVAALTGGIGIFLALIVAFMVNSAIDDLERSTISNLEATESTLADIEGTLLVAGDEIDSMDSNLDQIGNSMGYLSSGIEGSGKTMGAMGKDIGTLSLLGSNFGDYSESLNKSGEELITAARGLDDVSASISGEGNGLGEVALGLANVSQDINTQKSEIQNLRNSMKSTFDSLRMINILFFFLITVMLGMPVLNAMAGII